MKTKVATIAINEQIDIAYQFINPELSDDPLIIFLHEGLGSIGQWKDFPERLCKKTKLQGFVFERYGYGKSTPFFDFRTPQYLHKEAWNRLPLLLRKLQLQNKKIILVGHSDGASIALLHAAKYDNIIQVISIAAHVLVEDITISGIEDALAYYKKTPSLKEKLKKYHFEHVESTFHAWTDSWLKPEFKEWNICEEISLINCPVLAIQGEQDAFGTELQLEEIEKSVGKRLTTIKILSNCGHSPHIESKDQLLKYCTQFIKHRNDK